MNSRNVSPNTNAPPFRPANHVHSGNTTRSPTPHWQSPPWAAKQNFVSPNNFYNGVQPVWRNSYKMRHRYNSPNSPNFYRQKNLSHTSTPNSRSSGHGTHGSPSFLPLSYTPNYSRQRSPYSRGANYSRGKRSGDRPWYPREHGKQTIDVYFKPSMLQDPWKNCSSSRINKDVSKTPATQTSNNNAKRYFGKT
ncbi:uncharacterized protein LOC143465672 [Clavelina lepadiformis]|uniref:Uncharacterized protein n=1 Tax=Clavelina lepadiformis TaxID=159417 RepID=A0ABP0F1V2_CLALP